MTIIYQSPFIGATHPFLIVTLPEGLSINAAWKTLRDGRRARSRRYREWKEQVMPPLLAAVARAGITMPLTDDMELSIVACRPRTNSDVTNLVKTVEDALTEAGVWRDDKQVVSAYAAWARDAEGTIRRGKELTVSVGLYGTAPRP